MEGFIAGSRGGKTTSKEGRDYRWQQRWEDNIQGWKGVWAGSRGGKTTSMDGTGLSLAVEVGKTTSMDGRAYGWQ